ncbi:unnamed protein product [Pedinophyceae sp. YPF-701]|nr:unnamed protein product [Pedinophyceae sp. YPF-701]
MEAPTVQHDWTGLVRGAARASGGTLFTKTKGTVLVDSLVFFKRATAGLYLEIFGDRNSAGERVHVTREMFPRFTYVWERCTGDEPEQGMSEKDQEKLFAALDSVEKKGYLNEGSIVVAEMYISRHLEKAFCSWSTKKSSAGLEPPKWEMNSAQFASLMRHCGLSGDGPGQAPGPQVDLAFLHGKTWRTHLGLPTERGNTIGYLEFCLAVHSFSLALQEPVEFIFGRIGRMGDPKFRLKAEEMKRKISDRHYAAPLLRHRSDVAWLAREREEHDDSEADSDGEHPAPLPEAAAPSGWDNVRRGLLKKSASDLAGIFDSAPAPGSRSVIDAVWRMYQREPHKKSPVYRTIWIVHLSLSNAVSARSKPLMKLWAFKQFCWETNLLASEQRIGEVFQEAVRRCRRKSMAFEDADDNDGASEQPGAGLTFKQLCAALEIIGRMSRPPRSLEEMAKVTCDELGGPTDLDEGPRDSAHDPMTSSLSRDASLKGARAEGSDTPKSPSRQPSLARIASVKLSRTASGVRASAESGLLNASLPDEAEGRPSPQMQRFTSQKKIWADKSGPVKPAPRQMPQKKRSRLETLFEEYDALYDKVSGKLSLKAFARFAQDQLAGVANSHRGDHVSSLFKRGLELEGGGATAVGLEALTKLLEELAVQQGAKCVEDLLVG